tara:strand:+ start:166 stop:768 length:603 start_codon:yes stop_codon:yes gene_type:complete
MKRYEKLMRVDEDFSEESNKKPKTQDEIIDEKYPLDKSSDDGRYDNIGENVVLELTPEGMIVLKYDTEEKAFEYWSKAPVSYNILEMVARKYVKVFCKKKLFIDKNNQILLEKHKNSFKNVFEEMKKEINTKKTGDEELRSVFLKRKSVPKNKKHVMAKNANKYIRRGIIKESILHKKKEVKKLDSKKNLSFLDYKRLLS